MGPPLPTPSSGAATADTQSQQQMRGQPAKPNGQQPAKKQATPSQKRANHQQLQNQQQPNGAAQKLTTHKTTKPRQLGAKVNKLADQNESSRQSLARFSAKAEEIKFEISEALEKQHTKFHDEEANSRAAEKVEKLRNRIGELTSSQVEDQARGNLPSASTLSQSVARTSGVKYERVEESDAAAVEQISSSAADATTESTNARDVPADKLGAHAAKQTASEEPPKVSSIVSKRSENSLAGDSLTASGCFEPLTALLDPKSRFVALKSSLGKHFGQAPELLEPICDKLVVLSRQIDQLNVDNERQQQEITKLRLIKEKLGDLCRELQKSNNQIRIDSLGLIKSEQHNAREQADKIQSTLAGVMELFEENQQKNLALREENMELQSKLKALLDHCGNWEQCVNTALKQRDIENKLVKTELARLNLIRVEEQERFLKEKQDLLQAIKSMRVQQSRIEGKEAKLRSDLSSYASKYDECQEIIHNGLGKFQVESKRMLKQMERSRQDYVTLLGKYEASNKKITQLLGEKQHWMASSAQASRKLEALERLCRSLKSENDHLRGDERAARSGGTTGHSSSTTATRTPAMIVEGPPPTC